MTHVHITEREPGPWRDCSFAAVLEAIVNTWGDKPGKPPATIAEKERLRAAAGLPDNHSGATLPMVAYATEKLYGFSLPDATDVPDLALLPVGTYLVVQGSMGSLPAYWRRWSPSFAGDHSAVYYLDDHGEWWWCDPDAPAVFAGRPWIGEPMNETLVRTYHDGLPGARVATAAPPAGDPMIQLANITSPKRVRIERDGDLLEAPNGKRIAGTSQGYTYPYVGLQDGHYIVSVRSSLPSKDDVIRPWAMYVPTDIAVVEDLPPIPPSSAQDAVNKAVEKVAAYALSLKR